MRRELPRRRAVSTVTLNWLGQPYSVSFGSFEDGAPAEVFVSATKPGSDVQIVACDAAVLMSLALQHGVPLETIRSAMAREERGEPQSIIGAVADSFEREVAA